MLDMEALPTPRSRRGWMAGETGGFMTQFAGVYLIHNNAIPRYH
jgi:hypothetical protein